MEQPCQFTSKKHHRFQADALPEVTHNQVHTQCRHGTTLAGILEISNKLSDIGHPVNQELLCSAFLGSLPDEYGPLITSIEGRNDEYITSKYVREKILEESIRLNESRADLLPDTRALNTQRTPPNQNPKYQPTCYYCKKVGHIRRDCRTLRQHTSHQGMQDGNQGWGPRTHDNQNQDMHSKAVNMYNGPISQSVGSSGRNADNSRGDLATSLTELKVLSSHLALAEASGPAWLVDSGACLHMTRDLTLLDEYEKLTVPLTVTSAGGHASQVIGKGKRILLLRDNQDKIHSLTLNDIYYVPSLTDNLLAVSALEDAGYEVIFQRGQVTLQTEKETLILANRDHGLYLHREDLIEDSIKANVCEHIWHYRLGHRHFDGVHLLSQLLGESSIKMNPCIGHNFCDICHTTKMKNKPYPRKTEASTNQPFIMLHADLCGPIHPSSAGGNNYLLTIIDDHSRYLTTYPIKAKSEASRRIMEFIEHGENLHEHRPKYFRTDGGGEFASRELLEFFHKKGITHQVTIPYSPQSNGVAERFNLTLLETTRALLKQSGLSINMWAEMASTATYLININIHKNKSMTPYQLWNGHVPH